MVAYHNAKVQEMNIESEQLDLRIKVAQESETVIRNKHSKLKFTYHNLAKANKESNETIAELKNTINSMERVHDQQKATISGLKLRAGELAQANNSEAQELLDLKQEQLEEKDKEILKTKEKITILEMKNMESNGSDAQMEELLNLKEELLEEKDKELLESKEKITNLGKKNIASNNLVAAHERSSGTIRTEIKRLQKVEAEYLHYLDDHFGGKEEKMHAFMRTNLIREDCADKLIQRWESINIFRLDESSMFQAVIL